MSRRPAGSARAALAAALAFVLALAAPGCGSDDDPPPAAGESSEDSVTPPGDTAAPPPGDAADDATTTGEEPPPPTTRPDWFPASQDAPDEHVWMAGLKAPVRVIFDGLGIPHLYGETVEDVAFAQGYVTARARLVQMHILRMAASGRLAELLGPDSLKGDIVLRTLKLRATAEAMAERAAQEQPVLHARLVAFCAGANAWIDDVNAGTVERPLEVSLFGLTLDHWTPVDIMTVGRLQTWTLGFGGVVDPDDLFLIGRSLQETFDGTPLEGIEADVLRFVPPTATSTIDGNPASKPGAAASPQDTRAALSHPLLASFPLETLRKAREATAELRATSIHFNLIRGEDYGSNNWVVSGAHTASGRPLVCNDPHLSLRNPAIFYQSHGVTSDGEYNVSGINFAGAPGIVLGTNGHIAWGATVFFSDTTDLYIEDITEDGAGVNYQGAVVPFEVRKEVFRTQPASDGTCESLLVDWIANLEPEAEKGDDKICTITLTIRDVPHHGPLVPWLISEDEQGKPLGISWRWTGFEPTDELLALNDVAEARNWDEFKAAMDHFGVGAQNWIYGDTAGNIGWYPSHLLPIRKNIAAGDTTFVPYLPMPGDGSAEWVGFVPRSELPQAYNPESGYLVTANSDPTGTSFDGDPFNDGHYIGYMWTAGFRMQRAEQRLAEAIAAGKVTAEDMSAIQADHHSNLGERTRPVLLAALASDDLPPDLIPAEMVGRVAEAEALLEAWDLQAASGVDAAAGSPEAASAAATSLHAVWVTFVVENTFTDVDLLSISDHLKVRLLLRMMEEPESMVTYDAAAGQSRIWDDTGTEPTETMDQVLVTSLVQALEWLASEEGFGSESADDWRWGALHTLTMPHNIIPKYAIPAPSEHADGYPRHGDYFSVDASHPGMDDRDFTYAHGPAIRHVMEMLDVVERRGAIPGGQNEDPRGANYHDQADLWAANEAPLIPYAVEDVLSARASILDLTPP